MLSRIGQSVPELPVVDVERAQQYYRDVSRPEYDTAIVAAVRTVPI
jgi:hypothetical protein